MNNTNTTNQPMNRGGNANRVPRDHYQEVTDRHGAGHGIPTRPAARRCRATRRPASATGASTF